MLSKEGAITHMNSDISKLKESPIFALTLGGKELSHSNFWAWLIGLKNNKKQNPFVEVFFPEFYKNGYQFENCFREKKNRDITILYKDKSGDGKCFVIENKIKSIPNTEQLLKYSKPIEKGYQFSKGLLTGIDNTMSELPDKWEFMSYEAIAKCIIDTNTKNKTQYSSMIEAYAKDVLSISNIIKNEVSKYQDQYKVDVDEDIKEIRLADICKKHMAEVFKQEIELAIDNSKDDLKCDWGIPHVYTHFYNSKSIISTIYQMPKEEIDEPINTDDSKNEAFRIGIQIEGKEFRIYGGLSNQGRKLNYNDVDSLWVKMKDIGWLEEYPKEGEKGKTVRGKDSSMRGGNKNKERLSNCCSYIKDDYAHLYQYWDIKDNTLFSELIEEIKKELGKAKALIDSGAINDII